MNYTSTPLTFWERAAVFATNDLAVMITIPFIIGMIYLIVRIYQNPDLKNDRHAAHIIAAATTTFCVLTTAAVFSALAVIFAVMFDLEQGQYEAKGTILSVEQVNAPGQDNGPYKVDVMLENGDKSWFIIEISNPEDIALGNAFTLTSESLTQSHNPETFININDIETSDTHDHYNIGPLDITLTVNDVIIKK